MTNKEQIKEENVVDIAAEAKQKSLTEFVNNFISELKEKHGKQLVAQIQPTPNGIFPVMSLVDAQEENVDKKD